MEVGPEALLYLLMLLPVVPPRPEQISEGPLGAGLAVARRCPAVDEAVAKEVVTRAAIGSAMPLPKRPATQTRTPSSPWLWKLWMLAPPPPRFYRVTVVRELLTRSQPLLWSKATMP